MLFQNYLYKCIFLYLYIKFFVVDIFAGLQF